MKTCFKCNEKKPIHEFYAHKEMADGHLNKCKECAKRDVREHYKSNRMRYAEYESQRSKTPKRKEQQRKYVEKIRSKHPEKYKAHNITSNAIRDGKIKRGACEVCGANKAEAHHDNYHKPLEVRWLCRKHHLAEHGKEAYDF